MKFSILPLSDFYERTYFLFLRLLDDLLEDSSENEEAEEVIGEVLDEINLELTKDLEYNSQEVLLLIVCTIEFSSIGHKSWSASKRTSNQT